MKHGNIQSIVTENVELVDNGTIMEEFHSNPLQRYSHKTIFKQDHQRAKNVEINQR